ncbi:hypothetical protein MITS9508_02026 [Synechococcus sp. MIT S9508]|nr:hypothetical protein MITS9508_02026 [Synechococcus sp. MIT S9508]
MKYCRLQSLAVLSRQPMQHCACHRNASAYPHSKQDSDDKARKPHKCPHLVLTQTELFFDPEVGITICAH